MEIASDLVSNFEIFTMKHCHFGFKEGICPLEDFYSTFFLGMTIIYSIIV